ETPNTWRHSLSRDTYRSLNKRYGQMEMERQELIYDLYSSEKTFVQSARHVIRTYFQPLRSRDSRTWLPGLPADVARLFDWLEDIVNLHVALARALAGVVAVWKTGAIVSRVGGTLRAFVPQLEIYMPYLVKLDSVREILRLHAEKDRGELGEYLRMRERERVDGEWGLNKLLEEPVARLDKHLDSYQVRSHLLSMAQWLTRICTAALRSHAEGASRPSCCLVTILRHSHGSSRDRRGQGS
ncbi:Dbl homology domain-containing protein, partial [Polyporus arcularius HHB13444]